MSEIIGQKIVDIRPMTTEEYAEQGWDEPRFNPVMVLVLSDGTVLFSSCDYEGNHGGALFGQRKDEGFVVYVEPKGE